MTTKVIASRNAWGKQSYAVVVNDVEVAQSDCRNMAIFIAETVYLDWSDKELKREFGIEPREDEEDDDGK